MFLVLLSKSLLKKNKNKTALGEKCRVAKKFVDLLCRNGSVICVYFQQFPLLFAAESLPALSPSVWNEAG